MGAITIKDETQYLEGRIDTKQNITAKKKIKKALAPFHSDLARHSRMKRKHNTSFSVVSLFSLLETKAEDSQKPTIAQAISLPWFPL